MKQLIVFSLITLLIPVTFSQSQNGWVEEGTEWYYGGTSFNGNYYVHATYAGIENIAGINFQKVTAIEQWQYPQPDGSTSLGSINNHTPRYYLTSNDSVFLRKEDGSLQFIWHRNPQVGDVWDFGMQTDFQGENPMNAYSVVTNVEPIIIAGIETLQISTSPCLDAEGTLPELGDTLYMAGGIQWFNALFGPVDIFLTGFYFYSMETAIIEFLPIVLNCYRSSNVPFYQSNQSSNCYSDIILSNDVNENRETKIYPNPASSSFSLTNPEQIKSIQLFDVQGRLLSSHSSLPIQIEPFGAGMYWICLETLDGKLVKDKLVVEK
jgi:hypothetical protein